MNAPPDGLRSPFCVHEPQCPAAGEGDELAAHVIAAHPEQGWSLLCNRVVVFEDGGELRADGRMVAPRKPEPTGAWSRV